MKHEIVGTKEGQLGVWCSCGKKFNVEKAAEKHVADENAKQAETKKSVLTVIDEAGTIPPEVEPVKIPGDDKVDAKPAQYRDIEERVQEDATKEPPEAESEQPKADQPNAVVKAEQPLGPANMPLNLDKLTLNQVNFIGRTMAASGMFPDAKDAPKALVKILAGQEIGVTPFQAMTNIHIIAGKATLGAHLMAAKVKGTGKYDYRIKELSNEVCTIEFFQIKFILLNTTRESLGEFTYSIEDAKRADLVKPGSGWVKYPQNMLFARAISSGTRLHCPDVFNGNLVYVPEELGAAVDQDGEVVEAAK